MSIGIYKVISRESEAELVNLEKVWHSCLLISGGEDATRKVNSVNNQRNHTPQMGLSIERAGCGSQLQDFSQYRWGLCQTG